MRPLSHSSVATVYSVIRSKLAHRSCFVSVCMDRCMKIVFIVSGVKVLFLNFESSLVVQVVCRKTARIMSFIKRNVLFVCGVCGRMLRKIAL